MEIEDFVKELRDSSGKKQPTSEQIQKLVDIVNIYPCHIEAILLLIRIVWDYQYPGVTIFQWEGYYKKALEEDSECWTNQDLIKLYTLGTELYTYEEKDELAAEAGLRAYNLSPNAWNLLNNYLDIAFRLLKEEQVILLVHRMIELGMQDAMAQYSAGGYLQRLAYQNDIYRSEAIRAYQRALDLNLEECCPGFEKFAYEALIQLRG